MVIHCNSYCSLLHGLIINDYYRLPAFINFSRLYAGIPLCPELNDLENGYVIVTRLGPELLVGSTANYSCQDGYQLQGSQTRTCGEDGQWSGQEPTCN